MPQALIPVSWLFTAIIAVTVFLVARNHRRAKQEKDELDAVFSARANKAIALFAARLKREGIEPTSLNLIAQRDLDGQIDLKATDAKRNIIANGEYGHGDTLLSFRLT